MIYDVVVIGGGVIGCAIARELSRYDLNLALLEKNPEVCQGSSKANSAILHGGYDPLPGTLKARLNVEGNALCKELSTMLDFPLKETGSLVLAFNEKEEETLCALLKRGEENGVVGLKILKKEEVLEKEPGLSPQVKGALYCPSAGILCPFQMTYAFIENAILNGVQLFTDTEVDHVEKTSRGWRLFSKNREFDTRYVINAAGLYSHQVAALFQDDSFSITPRKGQYRVLDKEEGHLVHHVIFQTPDENGKGILITPTVHGNILMGPTSQVIENPEDTSTTVDGIETVDALAFRSLPNLPLHATIRLFAGLRASLQGQGYESDFWIRPSDAAPGLIHAAAIDSPGLVSSPAIARYVVELLQQQAGSFPKKLHFIEKRTGLHPLEDKTSPSYKEKLAKNPAYGHIICRCEMISYGEILDAIHRPAGAKTVDGIKRRVRPGSGRCQGGFCGPRILEILSRELHLSPYQLLKEESGSFCLAVPDLLLDPPAPTTPPENATPFLIDKRSRAASRISDVKKILSEEGQLSLHKKEGNSDER